MRKEDHEPFAFAGTADPSCVLLLGIFVGVCMEFGAKRIEKARCRYSDAELAMFLKGIAGFIRRDVGQL